MLSIPVTSSGLFNLLCSSHSRSGSLASAPFVSDNNAITYRYEMMRAVAQGILETAAHAFLLLIAVKWFEAGSVAKALVATNVRLEIIAHLP